MIHSADAAYPPEYFAAQIQKSNAKIIWQYGNIIRRAGIGELRGLVVVDVGCGAGPGLRYLAQAGAHALGLDHSLFALRAAQELSPDAQVVLNDSTGGLPVGDATADVVLLSELVEHVPDARPLYAECLRILRPGGAIIVTTPNLWDVRRALAFVTGRRWSGDNDPTHCNLYTPTRLGRELREAGFSGVHWSSGLKPVTWLSSRRLRVRLAVSYPPLIGNGLIAVGRRPGSNAATI